MRKDEERRQNAVDEHCNTTTVILKRLENSKSQVMKIQLQEN
jgi:hypothetical protein